VYLVYDEPSNRLVVDGARLHRPIEFRLRGFLAYSSGKTHLAPGRRLGPSSVPAFVPSE